MEEQKIVQCTFPGCSCNGIPELFYVPGRREVEALNGGPVAAADLPKFAVCNRCAKRLFRKEEVRTYLLVASQQALAEEEARAAYVARLKAVQAYQPKGQRPREGAVGQGLSRFRRKSGAEKGNGAHAAGAPAAPVEVAAPATIQ